MSTEDIEERVVEFLERREATPSLTPEAFAALHAGAGSELLGALRRALEVEALLPGRSAAGPARTIGAYTLHEEIGRGGMGVVYRASRGEETFALKLLPMAPFAGSRALERFRREAAALSTLTHPHIVRVHDSGLHDGVPYIVMDLIDGTALGDVATALSAIDAAALLRTLCDAVHAAHVRGVLHRDLKPQNVILRASGAPVLVDFGLCAADESPTLTATGQVLGTPRYMAPEQAHGAVTDARTDVYALGLILYELVTGVPARAEENREVVFAAVKSGRITRPRAYDASVPEDIERVVLTALAQNPARRYASADAMSQDLARFLRGEKVRARPPASLARLLERLTRPRAAAPSAEGRARAEEHLRAAVSQWLDGRPAAARKEVTTASRLHPGDPIARAMAAHLSGEPPAGSITLGDALRSFDEGALDRARADLAHAPDTEKATPLAAALRGLSALEAGDHLAAEEDLTHAAHALPRCVRVHRALGRACEHLGRWEEARRAYARAADIEPSSTEIWTDLAAAHYHLRDLDAGLASIEQALALVPAPAAGARTLRTLAALQTRAGRGEEARRVLSSLLGRDPGDAEAWYLLGFALDTDHLAVDAEAAYSRAVDVRPDHAEALLCLANIYIGASKGVCHGCDAVYAAHPELLSAERAERFVIRCIEADRGRNDWVTRSARDIAVRLRHRGAVIAALERLTRGGERAPATLRLEEMLRRLRQLEGMR